MSGALTMTCRRCGAVLHADPALQLGKRAYSYEKLVFRCQSCQVGYSNAATEADRVEITATPAGNVPAEVHEGLTETLSRSVNVVARAGKAWKFCSAKSEDAATWTVIRALQITSQIERIAAAARGADLTTGAPARVLFWGSPAPGSGPEADATARVLAAIADDRGEKPDRRSEPDAVVCWDDLVVVIEAKLSSANDRQTKDLDRFDRYLDRSELWAATSEEIKQAGFYELVRNWIIAWELAERTGAAHAVLVNLAPTGHGADVEAFRKLVAASQARRVEHLRWRDVLADPAPGWLSDYARRLGLPTL